MTLECYVNDNHSEIKGNNELTRAALNEKDWKKMQDRFDPLIYKMLLSQLPSSVVDDVAQDVRLKLYRSAPDYNPEIAKLVTWVMMITRREMIDNIRRIDRIRKTEYRYQRTREEVFTEKTTEIKGFLLEEMKYEIAKLPDRYKPVIEKIIQGRTHEQGARELGLPLGTFKSQVFRAMKELRAAMNTEREFTQD